MDEGVRARGLAFDNEVRRFLEGAGKGLNISTMTVCLVLEGRVDLDGICSGWDRGDVKQFFKEVMGKEDAVVVKNNKNFNNSVVLKAGKKATKVFCNGCLHVTGYNTIADVFEIGEVLGAAFEIIEGGNGLGEWYKVVGFDVQMINACWKVPEMPDGMILALDVLESKLREVTAWHCSFNSDMYSGVILSAVEFKLLVFESGCVIITSVKCVGALEKGFEFAKNFFASWIHDICVPSIDGRISKNKKKKGDGGGFDYGQFLVLK